VVSLAGLITATLRYSANPQAVLDAVLQAAGQAEGSEGEGGGAGGQGVVGKARRAVDILRVVSALDAVLLALKASKGRKGGEEWTWDDRRNNAEGGMHAGEKTASESPPPPPAAQERQAQAPATFFQDLGAYLALERAQRGPLGFDPGAYALDPAAAADAAAVFARYDRDDDGELSRSEFRQLWWVGRAGAGRACRAAGAAG
jgi:hypothetical protein